MADITGAEKLPTYIALGNYIIVKNNDTQSGMAKLLQRMVDSCQ